MLTVILLIIIVVFISYRVKSKQSFPSQSHLENCSSRLKVFGRQSSAGFSSCRCVSKCNQEFLRGPVNILCRIQKRRAEKGKGRIKPQGMFMHIHILWFDRWLCPDGAAGTTVRGEGGGEFALRPAPRSRPLRASFAFAFFLSFRFVSLISCFFSPLFFLQTCWQVNTHTREHTHKPTHIYVNR